MRSTWLAVLALVLLALLSWWEVRHPALPMTFELGAGGAAARLPAALVALATAVALGLVVAWTTSRTAAAYAVAVLVTTPLAFVPSRTALGLVHVVEPSARAATAVTFEHPLPALAYGLGPWVLLAAFALVGRLRAPAAAWFSGAAALVLLLIGLASRGCVVSVAVVAPLLAGAIGLELARMDRRSPSTTLAASVAGIGWLVIHDLETTPERLLAPLLGLNESDRAVIAAAATHAAKVTVPILGITTALVALLVWLPTRWLPASRGLLVCAVAGVAGLSLRLVVYPQLLARSSPSAAIETWSQRRGPGEPLAAMGLDPRELAHVQRTTGEPVVDLPSATAAGTWLASSDPARRWLALLPRSLAETNAGYRASRGANLPLLVGGDEATFLATSALHPGETSVNPLDLTVLDHPPPGLAPVDAEVAGALTVLGSRLVDVAGTPVASVPRRRAGGRETHLQIVLRVDQPFADGVCTFVHADRNPSRFAAEHRELPYPVRLWTPGEIVVDDFALTLPADFSAGSYPLFWGVGVLPCEDDRRREVTRGPSDGNGRIRLGNLEVR